MDIADDYTEPKTANPAPTTSSNKKTEAEKSDLESDKIDKKKKKNKTCFELAMEDDIPVEVQTSKRENWAELEIQLKQRKKSVFLPESSVKVDDSLQLSNRCNKRVKENISSSNIESSLNSKSLTSTSITSPKKPIKREEEWEELVHRRPLSSQENSGSAAGTTKKSSPIDQASATVSVIHSSERCKILMVPSNAIGRVIGYAGCNIKAIEEISRAVIDVEKQRKEKDVRTVLLMGMPEHISQAQQLISVLVDEPEDEFKKMIIKFKLANEAAKASGSDIPTEMGKNATFTSLTPHKVLPVSSAVKMEKKPSAPTAPPPSSAAQSYRTQAGLLTSVSVSTIAVSVADMIPPTSSPNSTSPVQDCLSFNSPFSQVDGTSMSDGNVVNVANVPGYQRNLNSSTAQSSLNLKNNNMPHVLRPIGNCFLPPTPQLETVPTLDMEEKPPPTSTSSLAPSLRMWRRQPEEQIQQHPFDEQSVPNLTLENGPMELPGQTFLLAPGVGRLLQRYVFSVFIFNMQLRLRQLSHHLPLQNFGTGYPVPIETSYREMELTVNLYPGPDVMTRTSDPSPNQPGLPGKL